ncbi:MAG TPA: OadG family protein [Candidatus Limnocylindrales bacterium]|nr:OadG family protein [Candidatus Limnocylindrales bacterium]
MDNLGFGLQVTLLGLGIVFGLLIVLWLLLTLALRFEGRSGSAATPAEVVTIRATGGADVPESLDPQLVAAITVAIVRHADARRRQAAPAMRSYWPGSLLFASRWVASGRMRQGQSWRRRSR